MNKSSLLIILFLVAVFAIASTTGSKAEDTIAITSKTYFGECVGYCQTTLLITSREVTLTEYSYAKSAPPRVIKRAISKNEWQQVSQNVPLKVFFALPDRIGDPDDADQGGEILEIKTDAHDKTSNFGYGAKIKGMEAYLQLIRKIREEMARKLPSSHS